MKNHINALIPNANANAIPTASHVKTTSKFILIPVIRGRRRGRGRGRGGGRRSKGGKEEEKGKETEREKEETGA